jgi:hypothetical protein
MKRYFLPVLIFISSFCCAQVPGYMGLKCTINYDLGLLPPQVVARTGTVPMLYHNVSVDYVVSRKMSVGIKYGFMTYNAPPETQQFSSAYSGSAEYNPNNYKGRYTQSTVAILGKSFFTDRGFIAPIGRYISYGLYFQHVVDHNATTYAGGNINYEGNQVAPTGFKGTAEYGGIIFGVGRNFVVANRILIDFGGNFSIPLGYVIGQRNERETVYRDLVLRNVAQIYLGLGVLAF